METMIIETPIGALNARVDEAGRLVELHFDKSADGSGWPAAEAPATGWPVAKQLAEYFSGKRTAFELDLAPRGTEFQLAVWNALLAIPYGDTISYAELARRIGKPSAVRAVGAANGANPIPVIIPCHRVIGSNGTLTGYGGGIERKQWLLTLEGRRLF
jgi:methylated-DNA-[protein]-cysteine S-methyltransferase